MLRVITVGFLVVIICISGLVVYKKAFEFPKIQDTYDGTTQILEPVQAISFADFGATDFTCTGLTYDSSDNAFWIGDYGALNVNDQPSPRIVEIEKRFSRVIREIQLDSVLGSLANLQGIAYDKLHDSIWLAIGESIVEIDKKGEILGTIDIGKYADVKANGICYNEQDDTLWVLCASRYLLHYKKDGTIIDEFAFNYMGQDHITIKDEYLYITVGVDYRGDNNYICKVELKDGKVTSLFRTVGANSLEGICIVGDELFIANDGLYHSDIEGHSYITLYPFSQIE